MINSLDFIKMINTKEDVVLRLNNFLESNADKDVNELRLKLLSKKNNDEERDFLEFAILQIEARRKFASKLGEYSSVLFPSMLAGEQSSNIRVGKFHADLISGAGSLLDLSAGLGIDFMSMSRETGKRGENSVAVEIDPVKAECLQNNLNRFSLDKAEVRCMDALESLKKFKEEGRHFDVIYVDPARRAEDKSRIYDPLECSPDVASNINLFFEVADRILVKISPMVDVKRTLEIFPDCVGLYIVAVKNECKEILVDLRKNGKLEKIATVDILSNDEIQTKELRPEDYEKRYEGEYITEDLLKEWLAQGKVWFYEPSATHMKLGSWNYLSNIYELLKSSPNSHIFFSQKYYEDFPGRILIVRQILNKHTVKNLRGETRNVVTRNYPLKAVPLAKKLRVKSCNDKFVYGLTISEDENTLLLDSELY